MDLEARLGERLQLPCKGCASLSLEIVVALGESRRSCPKCGTVSIFHIEAGPNGWSMRAPRLETPPSEEEE